MIPRPPRSTRTYTLSLHAARPISFCRRSSAALTISAYKGFAISASKHAMVLVDFSRMLCATTSGSYPSFATARMTLLCNSELAYRSEEHTSELQSLMRISYAVFCLKNKKQNNQKKHQHCTQ